ncbi:MAG TPA: hypothetical protein VMG38_01800 [Trebonia sp.]|nr:hypothetical protein [Trebonia sp.]
MYVGATAGFVDGIVAGLTRSVAFYSDYSISSNTGTAPYTSPPVYHPLVSLVSGIIMGVISGGLWLLMTWNTEAGRNWARVLSSILFGFACLQFIGGIVFLFLAPLSDSVPSFIAILVEWGVGLAALTQLWKRESSEFFAFARQANLDTTKDSVT